MQLKTCSLRDSFGLALVDIGSRNKKIIVLDADVAHPTRSHFFKEKFPERFVQVGIAEQNMIGVAAGFATCGFIPIAVCFASFLTRRCLDQIYNSICYPNLNVKLVGAYCGITASSTGASHQSFDDMAIMNTIPNITILDVGDPKEVFGAVEEIVKVHGPFYIRIGKIDKSDCYYNDNEKFKLGEILKISEGKDGVILSSGIMTGVCKKTTQMLKNEKLFLSHYHLPMIKPLNNKFVVEILKKFKFIFTVENHSVIGGLGSQINNISVKSSFGNIITNIGIEDKFGKCGRYDDLLAYFKISEFDIYNKIRSFLI